MKKLIIIKWTMQTLLFGVAISLSSMAAAQKVTTEIDKFTKQKKVTAEWAAMDNGFTSSASVGFMAVDSTFFIVISCTGSYADVIGVNDEAIFLLENGDTVRVWSPDIQTYTIAYTKYSSNSARHHYVINKDQIAKLAGDVPIVSFRKYGSDSYHEKNIKRKNADKVKKLAGQFLAAL